MVVESCSGDLQRNSCVLSPAEYGKYHAIASTRMILASLSVMGTLSIIILAIGKRQLFKSKIHPIFVLSLADFLLACLWIIGALIWMVQVKYRIWCLVVSLMTIIFQCITINLTLIYAIFAYHTLKRDTGSPSGSLLSNDMDTLPLEKVCRSSVIIGAYVVAWVTPFFLVMLTFAIVVGTRSNDIVTRINECSCWCLPSYGNVLPYAFAQDHPTSVYTYGTAKLLASFGSVTSVNYLIVFVLLIIYYRKILKYIKQLRQDKSYEKTHGRISRGDLFIDNQSRARTRVLLYLLIFIMNGLINFLLSLGLTFYEAHRLPHGPKLIKEPDPDQRATSPSRVLFIVVLMLQALTVPLQGFVNAIVYGWTRKEFVHSMALTHDLRSSSSNSREPPDGPEESHYEHKPKKRKTPVSSASSSMHLGKQMRHALLADSTDSIQTDIDTFTDTEA